MSFDPDAYLAATAPGKLPAPGGFDPDAYLAATSPDVLDNAVEDVKGIGKGLWALGKKAVALPGEAMDTADAALRGDDLAETPLAKDAVALKDIAVSAVPHPDEQGDWQAGKVLQRVGELTPGWDKVLDATGIHTDDKNIGHPIRSFKEHPVNTVLDVGAVVAPFLEGTEVGRGALAAAKGAGQGAVEAGAEAAAGGLDAATNAMGRRALGFTKRFLNEGGKREAADDAVRFALDKGVMTPGVQPEEMMARTSALKKMAGEDIGGFLKDTDTGANAVAQGVPMATAADQFFNPNKAIEAIEQLRPRTLTGRVLRGGEYDTLHGIVDNAIETIKAYGDEPMGWQEANKLKGDLQSLANYDQTASKAANQIKKAIGGTFKDSLDSQLETVAKANGGDITPFLEAKKAYGTTDDLQDALNNKISSEQGNRTIGLTDTIAGAGGAAFGGAPGAAGAIIVKKVLEKYGLTAGANLTDHMSVLVREAPQAFGKYAGSLAKAAARGDQALAATHFVLQQQEPEYRKLLESLAGK